MYKSIIDKYIKDLKLEDDRERLTGILGIRAERMIDAEWINVVVLK